MSGKVPAVVTYHTKEQRKVEIKCERLKENTKCADTIKCRRPLVAKRPQSDCGNIKNPWLLRCGVAFVAIVFVVICIALYSKMHAKMENMEAKLSHFKSLLFALEEKVDELENRIHCSVSRLNGTDSQGRSCAQHAQRQLPAEKRSSSPVRKKNGGKSDASKWRPSTEKPPSPAKVNKPGTRAQNRKTVKVRSNWTNVNTVYVAWGATKCPESDGTSDLYSGMVASSEGSEFLCLPESFYYENPRNVSNTNRVQLHPVKYGKSMELLGPRWNRKRKYARSESEVPCAVCRHSGRSAVLVEPAASNCPTGEWQREYRGYLMASENKTKRAEFICVNINAESKNINNGRVQSASVSARLQLTQYDYEPAHSKDLALACVVCLI